MRILAALGLLAFALGAQAQLYRWTDAGGKVHYTDTQPPADAKNVEKKGRARTEGAAAQPSYALQQAVENFPVTIYTAKDCGDPCKQGLDYLHRRGVPFTEKVVATQSEIDAVTKLAGAAQVPVMVVGTSVEKGYAARRWRETLDSAGYPKTSAP